MFGDPDKIIKIIAFIGIFLFFQWGVMLGDAIRRPVNLYKFGKKCIWIVLLLLAPQPTALIYHFTNRMGNLIPKKTRKCNKCGIEYSSEYFSRNTSICDKCYEDKPLKVTGHVKILKNFAIWIVLWSVVSIIISYDAFSEYYEYYKYKYLLNSRFSAESFFKIKYSMIFALGLNFVALLSGIKCEFSKVPGPGYFVVFSWYLILCGISGFFSFLSSYSTLAFLYGILQIGAGILSMLYAREYNSIRPKAFSEEALKLKQPAEEYEYVCENCGATVNANDKVCIKCGDNLKGEVIQ